MNREPDMIRADIEATRFELREDVDAIAEKVSPSGIARRQNEKARTALHRAREAVMGPAGEALHDAPDRVVQRTRGNPMAAGVVAFGAGMLLATLFPGSEKERELVHTLKEQAEPLTEELTEAARQVAGDMKEPVREAMENIKASAQDSVEAIKEEASTEAGHVRDQAVDAQANVSAPNPATGPRSHGERP